jgi:DNA-binding SARP family transcriptional activator/tetratricopeptide (TPR) repeat protein
LAHSARSRRGVSLVLLTRGAWRSSVKIEFNILGPPELVVEGHENIDVSPQQWCVLVSLLMTPNLSVPTEVLIDRLWGEDPPPKARPTIRSYIWRIDHALSRAQMQGGVQVNRQAHGYALEIDPNDIDLHRFRSLKRQSDALAESGEVRRAAKRLRDAEAIWRGGALAGLSGDWIARMRDSLEEERRTVVAHRIELELQLGRHAELLAELAELTERHPLDEGLAAQRMCALFRAGRQADALRAFREIRARLAAEGVSPTPELSRLHQRILQHDPELAITPVYRRAGQESQPNTLPPDISDFVGRAEEIQLLSEEAAAPDSAPTLKIIEGMGGIGKTALAVHVGHKVIRRYPDAQLFISFRTNEQSREPLDQENALRYLLAMLDVPAARIPGTLPERAELWRAELACRRAVIILDDVAGPDQIRHLLPDLGDCLVIVTCRQRHQDWGQAGNLPLRGLAEDDAASLFARIVGREAGGDSDHVAQMSRWCAGLPLAIRLAASRVRSGVVANLRDLLDELDEPTGGQGHGSEVSNRIEAVFDFSYYRLTAGVQRFFRYVGASPCCDITVASGAVLAGTTLAESRAALKALSEHYLLEETSPGRFGFHSLIRTFAATRFAREEPESEIRHAVGQLADYYIRSVERANRLRDADRREDSVTDDGQPPRAALMQTPEAAGAWLESEWSNALRVAAHCAKHEWKQRCADLVHALAEFLDTSGHWDDALAAQLMALQASRDLDDHRRAARAAFDLSLTNLRTGNGEAALQHATWAAEDFGKLGDKWGQAAALDRIGIVHWYAARYRESLAYHQEALDIDRGIGNLAGSAKALRNAGIALGSLGRHSEEMSYLNQALDIYRRSDDLRGQAITLNNIGRIQYYRGHHRDAMQSYQASREIFLHIGAKQYLTLVDHNIGRIYQYKGNYGAALGMYRRALVTYRSLGDLLHQAYALADIGSIYQCTGRFDEALAHHEKAASVADKVCDRYAYAEVLCRIAEVHYESGRLEDAFEEYEQIAVIAGEIESLYLRGKAINGMAEIALRTKGADSARIYWREAYDIFAQLGVAEAATVEIRLNTLDASASL